MSMRSWIRKLFTYPAPRPIRKDSHRYRLKIETLEDRIVPTSYSPGGDRVAGLQTLTAPLAMASTDHMTIDLGGATAGTQFDQINAANLSAQFDGVLNINLINGYTPAIGTQFKVVTGAAGTSGTFATVNLPSSPGLPNNERIVPVISPTGLTLVVAAADRPVQAQMQIPDAVVSNLAGFLGDVTTSFSVSNASTTIFGQTVTGNITLGVGVTATGNIPVVEASLTGVTASFGNGLVNLSSGQATFFFTQTGVVGNASVGLILQSGLPASLSGTFGFALNTTGTAFNNSVTLGGVTQTINVPAGPYVEVSTTGAQLTVGSQQVTGNFVLESATVIENTLPVHVVHVGASNVSAFLGVNGTGVQLSGGQGGFVIRPTGVAAQFSGNVSLVGGPTGLTLGGSINVALNNTGVAVNDTFNVGGGPISVAFPTTAAVQSFGGSLDLEVSNFVSVQGSFDIQKSSVVGNAPATLLVGVNNANVVFGVADPNGAKTGVQISGGSLGLEVLPAQNSQPTTYALSASGNAQVFVPGLTLSGSLNVLKNTTGATVNTSIDGVPIQFGAGQENEQDVSGTFTGQIQSSVYVSAGFAFNRASTTTGTATTTTFNIGAAGVTAFLGTGYGAANETGVKLTGGSLAMQVLKTEDTALTTQAPATYALDAKGAVTLELPDTAITANATLEVAANTTNTDVAQTITVPLPGGTQQIVSLNVKAADHLYVGGTLTLQLDQSVYLSGGFSFTDSSVTAGTVTTTTLTIGAAGVTAFVGAGYGSTNGDETGVKLTNGSLGLIVTKKTDTAPNATAIPATYALDAKGTAVLELPGQLAISAASTLEVSANTTGADVAQSITVPLPDGTNQTVTVTAAAADRLFVGGTLTVQLESSVYLSGGFSFTDSSVTTGTQMTTTLTVGAAGLTVFLGTGLGTSDETGVKLSNGSLGLIVTKVTDTNPIALPTPATYVLDARGTVALELPSVSLGSAYIAPPSLEVALNTSNTAAVQNITVPLSNGTNQTVGLNVPANEQLFVGGTLQLSVSGFDVSGGFSFSKIVTNPTATETDTTFLIGAANVSAGLTNNGVGIHLNSGALGLAVFKKIDTRLATQAPATYALDATGQFSLDGLPVTVSGNIELRLHSANQAVNNQQISVPGAPAPVTLNFAAGDPTSQFKGTGLSVGVAGVFGISGDLTVTPGATAADPLTIAVANPTLTLYRNGQQVITLGGGTTSSATFQLGGIDPATQKPKGFNLTNFNVGGFNFTPTSGASGGSAGSGSSGGSGGSSGSGSTPAPGTTLGPLTISGVSLSPSFSLGQAAQGGTFPLNVTLGINIASANLAIGTLANASITSVGNTPGITGTFGIGVDLALGSGLPSVAAVHLDDWNLHIAQIAVALGGGALTISATNVAVNPSAGPTDNLIRFGSVSTELKAGPIDVTGSASNFAITGARQFVAGPNFGVNFTVSTAGLGLPSFLPSATASVAIQWANFSTDPGDFQLTTSFDVMMNIGTGSFDVSVQGLTMNIDATTDAISFVKLDSISGNINTTLFGSGFQGGFIGGVARFDATGNVIPSTDTTTPVAKSVFYMGIEGTLTIPDLLAVTLRLGFSDQGPLAVYIAASSATGIPLGDTSLVVNNLYGSIEFDAAPLPQITDPHQLLSPAFASQASLTDDQWQAQLQKQLYRQVASGSGYLFDLPSTDAGALDQGGKLTDTTVLNDMLAQGLNLIPASATPAAVVTVLDPGKEWSVQEGTSIYLVTNPGTSSAPAPLSVRRILLDIPASTAEVNSLNAGTIDSTTQAAFSAAGIALSNAATVTQVTAGQVWLIMDGATQYDVNLRDAVVAFSPHASMNSLNVGTIRIEAGATVYDEAIPQQVLNAQADVIISIPTDGSGPRFAISAQLNLFSLVHARAVFYADLSQISSGAGNLDMLVDVPLPGGIDISQWGSVAFGPGGLAGTGNSGGAFTIAITGGAELATPVENLIASGNVTLTFGAGSFQVSAYASLYLTGDLPLGSAQQPLARAAADFTIDSQGLYGAADIGLGIPLPAAAGLTINAEAYFEINTTDQDKSVALQNGTDTQGHATYATSIIAPNSVGIYADGILNFAPAGINLYTIAGAFYLDINSTGLDLFVTGSSPLTIAPLVSIGNFYIQGALIIDDQGIAGELSAELATPASGASIFNASAALTLAFNTTGAEQGFQLPGALTDWLSGNFPQGTQGVSSNNVSVVAPSGAVDVPAGAPHLDGTFGPAGPYFVLEGTAQITIANDFHLLSASFDITIDSSGFRADFNAGLTFGPIGGVQAGGTIIISSAGVIVDASITGTLGAGAFSLKGSALLEINTTNQISNTADSIPPDTFLVDVQGSLTITNSFVIAGHFKIEDSQGSFTVSIAGTMNVFKFITLDVTGTATIVSGNGGGLLLYVDASLDAGSNLGGISTLFQIVDFNTSFHLEFDTLSGTGTDIVTDANNVQHLLNRGSVLVAVSSDMNLFGGIISMHGGAAFSDSAGVYSMSVNMGASFASFGFSVSGFFSSEGEFSIDLEGSIKLGAFGFGVYGSAGIIISYLDNNGTLPHGNGVKQLDVDGHANVDIKAFGVTLIGIGVDISYSQASTAVFIQPEVTILGITYSHKFVIGHLQTAPAQDPNLATLSNGVLTLNVGPNANARTVSPGQQDADYSIDENLGNLVYVNNQPTYPNATLIVDGFAGEDTYPLASVTKIVGNFGSTGQDSLAISSNVGIPNGFSKNPMPVDITMGGAGSSLDNDGEISGPVKLTGDSANLYNDGYIAGSITAGTNSIIQTTSNGLTITAGSGATITILGYNYNNGTVTIVADDHSLVDARNAGAANIQVGGYSEAYGPYASSVLSYNPLTSVPGPVTLIGAGGQFGGGDTLTGGPGNDTLIDTGLNATINASAGNDSITINDTSFFYGTNSYTINAGSGTDTVSFTAGNGVIPSGQPGVNGTPVVGSAAITGGTGNLIVNAISGNVAITTTHGNNAIHAGSGIIRLDGSGGSANDTFYGSTGNETIQTGSGADTIYDGSGTNTITAGAGNTTVYGGAGNLAFYSGTGVDQFFGGNGSYNLYFGDNGGTTFTSAIQPDAIDGGTGSTNLYLDYNATDTIALNAGAVVANNISTSLANIDSLTINTGFTLNGYNASSPITVTGNNDTVTVLNTAATTTLQATGQSATLNVDRTASVAPLTGNINVVSSTPTIHGLGLAGDVNYSGFAAVNIKLGSGDDSFTVNNTPANSTTKIDGEGGADTFNVVSFTGPVFLYGGAGSNADVASDTAVLNLPANFSAQNNPYSNASNFGVTVGTLNLNVAATATQTWTADQNGSVSFDGNSLGINLLGAANVQFTGNGSQHLNVQTELNYQTNVQVGNNQVQMTQPPSVLSFQSHNVQLVNGYDVSPTTTYQNIHSMVISPDLFSGGAVEGGQGTEGSFTYALGQAPGDSPYQAEILTYELLPVIEGSGASEVYTFAMALQGAHQYTNTHPPVGGDITINGNPYINPFPANEGYSSFDALAVFGAPGRSGHFYYVANTSGYLTVYSDAYPNNFGPIQSVFWGDNIWSQNPAFDSGDGLNNMIVKISPDGKYLALGETGAPFASFQLYSRDPATGLITRIGYYSNNQNAPYGNPHSSSSTLTSIIFDNNDNIWVGSGGGSNGSGVTCLSPSPYEANYFYDSSFTSTTFDITNLTLGANGTELWAGGNGGINRYAISFPSSSQSLSSLTLLQSFQNNSNGVTGLGSVDSMSFGAIGADGYQYFNLSNGTYSNTNPGYPALFALSNGSILVFGTTNDGTGNYTLIQRMQNGVNGVNLSGATGIAFDSYDLGYNPYPLTGSDELLVADAAGVDNYQITTPVIVPPFTVSFSGMSALTVSTADANQITVINSSPAANNLTINTGSAGANDVVIENTGTGEAVTVNSGSDGSNIQVDTTGVYSSTVLNGGAGADSFRINGKTLGGGSHITVSGAAPTTTPGDSLTIDGAPTFSPSQTATSVQTSSGIAVSYSGIEKTSNPPVSVTPGQASYTINEGNSLALSASSTGGTGAVTFGWDIRGNGQFTDAAGSPVTLTWASLEALGITHAGIYAISVLATDSIGNTGLATVNLIVNATAPTLSAVGNASVQAGAVYSLALSATAPGVNPITSWTVNWQDGTVTTYSASSPTAQHIYTTSGNYSISVTALDLEQPNLSPALSITKGISVSPPAAPPAPTYRTITGASAAQEGSLYTLSLNESGPGLNNLTGWTINWGDGQTSTVSGNPGAVTHTYMAAGNFTILAATTEAGVFHAADDQVSVQVSFVAPTLTVSGSASTPVNVLYALNLSAINGSAPVSQWTVNWGDGSTPDVYTVNNGASVTATHSYTATASVTISASAQDANGSYNASPLSVNVTTLAPNPSAQLKLNDPGNPNNSPNVAEGQTVGVQLQVNDSNSTPNNDTWAISWGDGTTDTLSLTAPVQEVTHVYHHGSPTTTDTIQATAQISGANYTAAPIVLSVADTPPTIAVTGPANGLTNNPVAIQLGAVVDPGDETVSQYAVNWGDGHTDLLTPAQIAAAGGNLSHVFSGTGNFTINVDLTDQNGVHASAGSTAVQITTGPRATISNYPLAVSNSSAATFGFTGTSATTFQYSLDNSPFAAATGNSLAFSNLADGPHTFQVEAIDSFGNISVPASFQWNVDTTAPTASITDAPPATTYTGAANFSFFGADPHSNGYASGVDHLVYWLDSGSPSTVPGDVGSANFTGLATGPHTFHLEAFDAAGNDPETDYTWTIASKTAQVTVTAASGVYTGQPYSALGAAVSADGATILPGAFTYTYYSGPFATGTGTSNAPVNAGTYTVIAHFTPTDAANYAPADSYQTTFSITPAVTSVAIDSSNPSSIYGQAVTFTAAVNNASAGTSAVPTGAVQFIVDGVNFGTPVALDAAGHAVSASLSTLPASATLHSVQAMFINTDGNFQNSSSTLAGGQSVSSAGTATATTSSANPSIYGQAVTFTAIVSNTTPGSAFVPTGSIQFVVDGANFGTPVALDATGKATISAIRSLAASNTPHTIQAIYVSANANFLPSTTTLANGQSVTAAATSIAVASSLNASVYGQAVTFTATMANATPGSNFVPTGSVQFLIDGANFGAPVALDATGKAISGAINSLAAANGPHAIKAVYVNADGNFQGGFSTLASGQTVTPAATSTTVASSLNASVFGQAVTFTATISDTTAGSNFVPTGSVQFVVDGSNFGTPVPVNALGKAVSNALNSLAASSTPHAIQALYITADGNFLNSANSLAGGQSVTSASTGTTVASSLNPSLFGQTVLFTATISDTTPGSSFVPTGSVQFVVDGANFGIPVALDGMGKAISASLNALTASASPHTIKAVYLNANNNFQASNSTLANGQGVNAAASSVSVASSLNASVYGQAVSFTATVSDTTPGSSFVPTGSVQFVIDGVNFGSPAPLNASGKATSNTLNSLSAGSTHTIKAIYLNTDGNFQTSNNTLTGGQAVTAAAASVAVTSSLASSIYGQAITFTATVSNATPGSSFIPTGSVQFVIDGSNFGAPVALNAAGQALGNAISTLSVAGSPHTVQALYLHADANFQSSNALLGGGESVTAAATSTTVATSVNPSLYGQPVTFTATIANTSVGSSVIPVGTVQFVIDGGNVGTPVTLDATGKATLSLNTLAATASAHSVSAVFTNSVGNFQTSSNTLAGGETVFPATTATAIASSANPAVFGQPLTFTATVTDTAINSGFIPTGSVQFVIDGANFGTPISLNASGIASMPDAFWSGASHTIKAVYTPTGFFVASNNAITQTVQSTAVESDPASPSLTDLFIASSGATSNDSVQITPVGASLTGSTGIRAQTTLNGVFALTTYTQSFNKIFVYLQNGNDNVQMASTLTIAAYVSAGNGNDNVQLGAGAYNISLGNGSDNVQFGNGNATVALGNGNDNVQLGNGNDSVTLGNGCDNVQLGLGNNAVNTGNGNVNVQLGAGNNTVTVGNGNDNVQLGSGNNSITVGTGFDNIQAGDGTNVVNVGAAGSLGNVNVQLGNGANNVVNVLGNGNDHVQIGNGANAHVTITGNGIDQVQLGNGNADYVAITGNGNDFVQLGSGANCYIAITGNGSEFVSTGGGSGQLKIRGNGFRSIFLGAGWTQI